MSPPHQYVGIHFSLSRRLSQPTCCWLLQ